MTGNEWQQALSLQQAGKLDAAEKAFLDILKRQPGHPGARYHVGLIRLQRGAPAEAVSFLKPAAEALPDQPGIHLPLGHAYLQTGDAARAEQAFAREAALSPQLPQAHIALGLAVCRQGRMDEGIEHLRQALVLNPDDPACLEVLGRALFDARRFPEAAGHLEQALRLNPENSGARSLLAAVRTHTHEYTEAVREADRVLAGHPEQLQAWFAKATALVRLARPQEAVASLDAVLKREPDNYKALRDLTMVTCYRTHPDPATLVGTVRRLAARMEQGLPDPADVAHRNSRAPERRLTVGFVSPDLRTHSVAYFLEPLFAHHDRNTMSFQCYAHLPGGPDETTARLSRLADHWVDIGPMSDEEAASAIRGERVDILIDLAGHTEGSRVALFARRPAPVQATWLGSPVTTGLRAMDYRITDAHTDPPEQDAHGTETLLRLPSFLCYAPPGAAPDPGPPPVLENGHITFGSFNNFAKYGPEVAELWSRVLRAVPGSRLLLKASAFSAEGGRERCREMFREHGIDVERLDLLAWLPGVSSHLEGYHKVDIALDTLPYNGTTTTCEALWMGVPVVTLAGDRHMGRVGVSLLTGAGLPELIAATQEDFVRIAAGLADDRDRLKTLHRELRDRVSASPLCDGAAFARSFEAALRGAWRNWCQSG